MLSEYVDKQYSVHSNWLYFIRDVAQFLKTPHIIERFLLTVWNSKSTGIINGRDYLNRLGLSQMGNVLRVDDITEVETFFPLTVLEEDSVNGLAGGRLLLDKVENFVNRGGVSIGMKDGFLSSRAKIFLLEETTERVFELIVG